MIVLPSRRLELRAGPTCRGHGPGGPRARRPAPHRGRSRPTCCSPGACAAPSSRRRPWPGSSRGPPISFATSTSCPGRSSPASFGAPPRGPTACRSTRRRWLATSIPTGRLADRLSVTSPGVDLDSFRPRAMGRCVRAARCCCWARSCRGSVPTWRSRRWLSRPASSRTCDWWWPARPWAPQGERLLAAAAPAREPARSRWPGALRRRGRRSPHRSRAGRGACCTAPTARPSAACWCRRWPPAGRWWPRRAPARSRSWTRSCGRLYPPGDAAAAARALVEVLGDPDRARELGAAARSRRRALRRPARPAGLRRAWRWRRCARRAPRPPEPPGSGMALVTVTHNSRRGGARRCCARCAPTCPARGWWWWTRAPGTTARRPHGESSMADTVLELGENAGFGRASNAGVALVEEPVCVLVNPDVELIDDSLASLAAALEPARGPERILAPVALSPDGSRQDTAQLDPGSPLWLLRALVPPAALPAALRRRVDPWLLGRGPAGGLGGGVLPGGPHRDAAPPRPLRRAHLPVRRGPRARDARRGGGRRDLVLPAGPGGAPRRPLHRAGLRRRATRAARPPAAGRDRRAARVRPPPGATV